MARRTYTAASSFAPPGGKTGPNDPISSLNSDQINNIKTIIGVSHALGMPDTAIVSALAAANDESTFLNYASSRQPQSLNYPHQAIGHDGQSVGVFQQQVGYGWGGFPEIMDVAHQTMAFYGASPKASSPGMLQQQGWQNMDPGRLAQMIQQSGTPNAYYPLVQFAQRLLQQFGNTQPIKLPIQPKATGPGGLRAPQPPAPPPMPRGGGRGKAAPWPTAKSPYSYGYTNARPNSRNRGSYQNPGNGGTYYGGGYTSSKRNKNYKPLQGRVFPRTYYGGGYSSARPGNAPARSPYGGGYSYSRPRANYGGGYSYARPNPRYNGGGNRPYGGGYTSSRPTTYYGGGYTSSRPTAPPAPQYVAARASGGGRFR